MSSSERGNRAHGRQSGTAAVMTFAAVLFLSACTVQPVYGPAPATTPAPAPAGGGGAATQQKNLVGFEKEYGHEF